MTIVNYKCHTKPWVYFSYCTSFLMHWHLISDIDRAACIATTTITL